MDGQIGEDGTEEHDECGIKGVRKIGQEMVGMSHMQNISDSVADDHSKDCIEAGSSIHLHNQTAQYICGYIKHKRKYQSRQKLELENPLNNEQNYDRLHIKDTVSCDG